VRRPGRSEIVVDKFGPYVVRDTWPYKQYPKPPTVDEAGGIDKVVLISGFREWDDPTAVEDVLEFLSPTVLIHGAAVGVDWFADRWAEQYRGAVVVERHMIPPKWYSLYGKQAPLMRNQEMVYRAKAWEDAGHRVLVVAFPQPGSTGTIDLMEKAIVSNLPVLQYQ
jgi:hypothetical protein